MRPTQGLRNIAWPPDKKLKLTKPSIMELRA
jgi:hypothetical protein